MRESKGKNSPNRSRLDHWLGVAGDLRVWFGFFLNSFSEKLAVGKSWLLRKAVG
jgi:hypothetical protein